MSEQFESFVNAELPRRVSIEIPASGNLTPGKLLKTTGIGLQVEETDMESTSSTEKFDDFVLSQTNLDNKFVILTDIPDITKNITMEIRGAPHLTYSLDFVRDNTLTTKIRWDNLGIDGVVMIGDEMRIIYSK